MKKFIIANGIMLALVNTGLALTPQQFARDFIKNNLELKINENIAQSSIHEIESNWGRYTPSLMAKLGWSEDKSDPLMPQLPHHLEQSYGEVGIASQTAYGIGVNLSTKQDSSNQTVNTSDLERARSEIAGKISVDLMKNIAGRIDLHQQRNWPKLQEIAKMQQVEKNEILLFQALSLFAQYNYLQEQSSVTKEIEKNA